MSGVSSGQLSELLMLFGAGGSRSSGGEDEGGLNRDVCEAFTIFCRRKESGEARRAEDDKEEGEDKQQDHRRRALHRYACEVADVGERIDRRRRRMEDTEPMDTEVEGEIRWSRLRKIGDEQNNEQNKH